MKALIANDGPNGHLPLFIKDRMHDSMRMKPRKTVYLLYRWIGLFV